MPSLRSTLILALSISSFATGRVRGESDAKSSLPKPTRPLEWKDVNFLSTSDTHGEVLFTKSLSMPQRYPYPFIAVMADISCLAINVQVGF